MGIYFTTHRRRAFGKHAHDDVSCVTVMELSPYAFPHSSLVRLQPRACKSRSPLVSYRKIAYLCTVIYTQDRSELAIKTLEATKGF